MIPLRTPAQLTKFPTSLLLTLCFSVTLTLLFGRFYSSSDSIVARMILSLLIFPSWSLGIVCAWYLWIFAPCFLHRPGRGHFVDVATVAISFFLCFGFLRFGIEAAWSYVFTVLLLGAVMRDQIWENVDTLVIGPKLFSIYAVPCYVHVFFFFFYIFISQLVSPAFGLGGKNIYLVALISFVAGFLLRSFEFKGLKG